MPPRPISKRCQFCRKTFPTQRAVNQHISASTICLEEWHKIIVRKNDNPSPKRRRINSPEPSLLDDLPNPDPTLARNLEDADNSANVEDSYAGDGIDDDLETPKRYVDPFPELAGDALRRERTRFEILEGEQHLKAKTPWEPFANKTEWGLVEWLMKNVGQKSTDEYLKLPIVS